MASTLREEGGAVRQNWDLNFFDSDDRQWSHPLMIPLHGLWAKLSNGRCGQFECDVLGVVFVLISFVQM